MCDMTPGIIYCSSTIVNVFSLVRGENIPQFVNVLTVNTKNDSDKITFWKNSHY